MSIRPKYCEEAATHLSNSFTWAESPEGDAFWRAIRERLARLGHGNPHPAEPVWKQLSAGDAGLLQRIAELTAEADALKDQVTKLKRKLLAADFLSMR